MTITPLTIRSRPEEDIIVIGSGTYQLNLTTEQLYLISAYVCQTRLGQPSPYSAAAYDLLTQISATVGEDVMDDACIDVDLRVTVDDPMTGDVVFESLGTHCVTLEA